MTNINSNINTFFPLDAILRSGPVLQVFTLYSFSLSKIPGTSLKPKFSEILIFGFGIFMKWKYFVMNR